MADPVVTLKESCLAMYCCVYIDSLVLFISSSFAADIAGATFGFALLYPMVCYCRGRPGVKEGCL